ncbi:hypothetical protein PIB30_033716 [Stylosanthes scabra]|uniref:Uncharacterized protein n=1 Tax=Stylosanthes scabra TaxID=79078 RepID=A0ABU6YBB6_9FABA|nr:hypothetical protein [Stylosanthes scabra]
MVERKLGSRGRRCRTLKSSLGRRMYYRREVELMELDPMIYETRIAKNISEENLSGPMDQMLGPNGIGDEGSSRFCPYPPGFEPCSDQTHVHYELARAGISPQPMRDTLITKAERGIVSLVVSISPINLVVGTSDMVQVRKKEATKLYTVSMKVDDGVNHDNEDKRVAIVQVATSSLGGVVAEGLNKTTLGLCNKGKTSGEIDTLSEETLYCLNYDVASGALHQRGSGVVRVEKQDANGDMPVLPID